ncbi:diadenosine tetraphosphate hydrolase [Candidatus Woesearchaeota archaeon]|nr:MAG: diadenosine tetraphosphate hydrolase [Candidatus Woesearchaeota archaeon]
MPFEYSAGAIVFRRTMKGIRYLLLHYPSGERGGTIFKGHWGMPKGNIEKGEDPQETILREVKEETGLKEEDLIIQEGFKKKIGWFYKRDGKTIYKEVIYVLAESKKEEIKLSEEHEGYVWASLDTALKKIKFNNLKEVLKNADEFLKEN